MIIDNIEHRMAQASPTEIRIGPGPVTVRDAEQDAEFVRRFRVSADRLSLKHPSSLRTFPHEGRSYGVRVPRVEVNEDTELTVLRTFKPSAPEELDAR